MRGKCWWSDRGQPGGRRTRAALVLCGPVHLFGHLLARLSRQGVFPVCHHQKLVPSLQHSLPVRVHCRRRGGRVLDSNVALFEGAPPKGVLCAFPWERILQNTLTQDIFNNVIQLFPTWGPVSLGSPGLQRSLRTGRHTLMVRSQRRWDTSGSNL